MTKVKLDLGRRRIDNINHAILVNEAFAEIIDIDIDRVNFVISRIGKIAESKGRQINNLDTLTLIKEMVNPFKGKERQVALLYLGCVLGDFLFVETKLDLNKSSCLIN